MTLSEGNGNATALRRSLKQRLLIVAPGIFDCVSARVVARSGFEAAYITGHGLSNSTIGETDIGLLSFGELRARVRDIVGSISIPVIVDADTGYGGPLNVQRTVRELEQIGAAAVQIEDQHWPKKCGHMPGKELVSEQEMVQKVRAAIEARRGDLVLIARTDALAVEGFDAAVRRCRSYYEAGADVVFIDALGDRVECERAVSRLQGIPVMANMVEGSRTAYMSVKELKDVGFSIAIWPITLLLAAITAMQRAASELREQGCLRSSSLEQIMRFPDFLEFWDFAEIQALEKRYSND
jgi:2-methylisocitrate lyase-like PEP mutase family enzyme